MLEQLSASKALANLLRPLGHPERLRIFLFLKDHTVDCERPDCSPIFEPELDVGDLAADGCCAKSTLSHHLAELRGAGLILCEKKGRRVICRANPDAVAALREVFALRIESEN